MLKKSVKLAAKAIIAFEKLLLGKKKGIYGMARRIKFDDSRKVVIADVSVFDAKENKMYRYKQKHYSYNIIEEYVKRRKKGGQNGGGNYVGRV